MKRKQGFTLIELLVVITILAILVGAALPYVQNYVEESRQAKAKSDLDEIARALVIYESREGEYTKSTVEDLTGRYLDRSPIDPWGVPYVIDTKAGIVYSTGPDRKDIDRTSEDTITATEQNKFDNIEVSYVPPLALVSVKWVDKNKSGAVDTQNVQDELHLTFSRKLGPDQKDGNTPPTESLTNGGDNVKHLLLSLEIQNDPNNLTSWKTLITDPLDTNANVVDFTNDWGSVKIVGNNKIVVLPISKAFGVAGEGKGHFVAGRDKIRVKDAHGVIADIAEPANLCIANQEVVILPQ